MTGASPQARVRPGRQGAGLRLRLRAGVQPALMGERVGTQLGSRLWSLASRGSARASQDRDPPLAPGSQTHTSPVSPLRSGGSEAEQNRDRPLPRDRRGQRAARGTNGRSRESASGPSSAVLPGPPGPAPARDARRGRGVSGGLWSPAWSDFRGATAMTCAERPERGRGGGGHREQGPATDCVRRTDGPSRWREGQARSSGKAEGRK